MRNVLLAYPAPEDIVVRKAFQRLHRCDAAEGSHVEIIEELEGEFARESGERAKMCASCFVRRDSWEEQEPLEEDEAAWEVRRGREVGPNDGDGLALRDGEGVEILSDAGTMRVEACGQLIHHDGYGGNEPAGAQKESEKYPSPAECTPGHGARVLTTKHCGKGMIDEG